MNKFLIISALALGITAMTPAAEAEDGHRRGRREHDRSHESYERHGDRPQRHHRRDRGDYSSGHHRRGHEDSGHGHNSNRRHGSRNRAGHIIEDIVLGGHH